MNLIIALIITTLFYLIAAKSIKKYAEFYYIGTYAVLVIVVLYHFRGWAADVPTWFDSYIMSIFTRGIFSTTTFMVVMFLGVVTKPNSVSRRLFSIRGEMSIMGCIFALAHNIAFGLTHFKNLIFNPSIMPTPVFIASLISLVLIAMMIPLGITSFKTVRKKMNGKSWKNLQRMAYPFFILIYVHIMVLYSMMWKDKIVDIVVYSVIFGSYIILRLRKYAITRAKKRKAQALKSI